MRVAAQGVTMTRLGEGVWWIDLWGVNAYVVDDGGTLTLVDAGFPWSTRAVVAGLAEAGGSPGDLERVLITHYDVDHVGALASLAVDATVYVGRDDAPFLTRERLPPVTTQKGLFQRAVDWLRSVPELPVEPVDDGDEVGSFTAYHTGGHTPGHTVFASERLDAAFLGDLVMERGGKLVPTPWFICQDHDRALEAIVELEGRLPPFETAAVGHGVPFVEGGDRRLAACARRRD